MAVVRKPGLWLDAGTAAKRLKLRDDGLVEFEDGIAHGHCRKYPNVALGRGCLCLNFCGRGRVIPSFRDTVPHTMEEAASWFHVLFSQSKQRSSAYSELERGSSSEGVLQLRNGSAIFESISVKSSEYAATATPILRAATRRVGCCKHTQCKINMVSERHAGSQKQYTDTHTRTGTA